MAIVKDGTYPRYWAVDGTPTLLLGGSDKENLFQWDSELNPGGGLGEHLDALQAAGGNFVRMTLGLRFVGTEVAATAQYPWLWTGSEYDLDQWNTGFFTRLDNCLSLCAARGIVAQIELFDGFDWANYDAETQWTDNPMNPLNNSNYTELSSGVPEVWTQYPWLGWNPLHTAVYNNDLTDPATIKAYLDAYIDHVLDTTVLYPNTVLFVDGNETPNPVAWTNYWADFVKTRYAAEAPPIAVSFGFMRDTRPQDDPAADAFYDLINTNADIDFGDISQASHNDADDGGNAAKEPAAWFQVLSRLAYTSAFACPLNLVKVYHPAGDPPGRSQSTDNIGYKMGWRTFPRMVFAGAAGVRFHRDTSDLIGLSTQAIARIKACRAADNQFGFIGSTENGGLISSASTEVRCRSRADKVAVLFINDGSCTVDLTGHGSVDTISWYNTDSGLLHTQEAVAGGGSPTITTPTAGADADWIGIITEGGIAVADWLAGWSYRFPVTSDNTKVDEAVTNLVFDLADAPAAFWPHVKGDGSDVRVTSADGSTEVAREVAWGDIFYDDFTTYDAAKWGDTYYSVTAPTIAIVGGRLSITVDDTGDTYGDAYVYHTHSLNLTARGHLAIECVSAPSPLTGAISWLLKIDNDNFIGFVLESDGSIRARENVVGTTTDLATDTYSNTTHRWWRMREASGTLYWEVSTDGASWNTFYSKATPIAVTALQVSIYQWTDTGVETSTWDHSGYGGGGRGLLYLNTPGLSTSVDTDYYVYYGNAAATEPAPSATYGRENVWDSSYKIVMHGHSTSLLNSCGSGIGGTLVGGTPSLIDFGVHRGFRITGLSQYVQYTGLPAVMEPFTIEEINRFDEAAGTAKGIDTVGKWDNFAHTWHHASANNVNASVIEASASTQKTSNFTGGAADTTYWRQSRNTANNPTSGVLRSYTNGVFSEQQTDSWFGEGGNTTLRLSEIWQGATFTRDVAEFRLSNTGRSNEFLTTHYKNQSDPTTFWAVGVEEGTPPATISREAADIALEYQTDTECHVSIDTVDVVATTHKLYGHTSDLGGSIAAWEASATLIDDDVAAAEIIEWAGRTPNTPYYFVVISDSLWISSVLPITTAYARPTGATQESTTNDTIAASWTDQSSGAASHMMLIKEAADPDTSLVAVGVVPAGQAVEFSFTGLNPATQYSVQALAYDGNLRLSGRTALVASTTGDVAVPVFAYHYRRMVTL